MLLGPKHTNCPSFVVGDYSSVHTATRAFTRTQRVRLSQSDILEAVYAILLDAEHSNGDYVEFVHRTNLRYFPVFSISPSPLILFSSSQPLLLLPLLFPLLILSLSSYGSLNPLSLPFFPLC